VSDPIEPDPPPGHSAGGGNGSGGDNGGDNGGGGEDGSGQASGGDAGDVRWKAVPDGFWWIPFLIGVGMLLGYGLFLSEMIEHVGDKDPNWSRLVYLFSGVEALAFGAAGFFFGREVHRGRADAAESRADAEARRASESEKKAATNGARARTLAELADGAPAARRGGLESAHLESTGANADADARVRLEAIVRLGRQWFPRA
jgi:hypothetical protein